MEMMSTVETVPPFKKKDDLSVVFNPHPILAPARPVVHAPWEAGKTVRQHLLEADVDPHMEIVVRVNGVLITVEEWDRLAPDPGALITVEGVVSGGGGGGSNPVQMVLMIAVAVYAPYLANYIGGSGFVAATAGTFAASFTGALVTGGIIMAGSMVIGALFKPAMPSMTNAASSVAQESPTYSLSGGSNSVRPYEPLPVVLGTHRIFPDYGSKPYTELEGDDQYLYQVFNFGIGHLLLSDLRIGETDIKTYEGVTITRAENGVLPGFYGNVDSTAGAALANPHTAGAGDWVVRTTGPDTVRIALDIEGTYYYANDSGGLSERSADFNVEYAVKDSGDWQPFVPDEYSTPLTHYWSKGAFLNEITPGYWDNWDNWVPEVVSPTRWVQAGFDSNFSATAHTELQSAGTGRLPVVGIVGALDLPLFWHWVPIGTDPHPSNPYTADTNLLTMRGSSTKALRKTLSRVVPAGQYDVRVRRVSKDETESRYQSTTSWSVLRSYQQGTADYSWQTVLGIKIKASGQLNGAVQQLSALAVNMAAVFVHGSFTAPAAGWYWLEEAGYRYLNQGYNEFDYWTASATLNPAWWYLHFLRGVRDSAGRLLYGCGLSDAQIDIEAIKAWAVFCDAQGLHFSAVLDRAQTASDVLAMITRCGFGSPTWASGKLGVVWDAVNQSAVACFGMSNICAGSFVVQYMTDNLADEIIVRYTNRNNSWQQDEVRVTVPGTVGTPVKPVTVDLTGCTANAMAARFANALAAQQFYRRRQITFETDMEGFTCQRGDVVLLSHDLTQWGYSGRVVSVAGNTITLPRTVPRSGAAEHLLIQFPNGTAQHFDVVAGSGEGDVLTLTAPITLQSGYEAVDHLWFFSPQSTPGKKVKITSVQPISEYRVRLVATDEVPEYYAAWGGSFTAPAQVSLLSNKSASIKSVQFSETLLRAGAGFSVQLMVLVEGAGAYASSKARMYLNGAIYREEMISGAVWAVQAPDAGHIDLTLTPMNGIGTPGAPFSASYDIVGKSAPPGNVSALTAVRSGAITTLTIAPVADVDLAFYRIKKGSSWASAGLVMDTRSTAVSVGADFGSVQYLVKAVDTSGNESVSAAMVTVNWPAPATVPWFALSGDVLNWGQVADAVGYRIRFSSGYDTSWANAQPAHDGLVASPPWSMIRRPSGASTVLIKAVDVGGQESDGTAEIHFDFGDQLVANVIQTVDFKAAGWPGSIAGGSPSGGNLQASGLGSFYRNDDAAPMFSADSSLPVFDDAYGSLEYITAVDAVAGNYPEGSRITLDIGGTSFGRTVEYRLIDYRSFYALGDDTPMFSASDSDPVYSAPTDWIVWPGVLELPFNCQIGFRVIVGGGRLQGEITAMTASVDVPDIAEQINDFTVSAAGSRLPLSRSYAAITNLQLTLQDNGGAARTLRIIDKLATGPLVKCFDAAGNAVSGLIDASIQGY